MGDGNDVHLQVVLRRGQLLELFLERQKIDKFNIQEKLGIGWGSMEEILDDDIQPISPPIKDRILNKATIAKEERKILAEVLGRSSITVTKEIEEKIFFEVVAIEKNCDIKKFQQVATSDKSLIKQKSGGRREDMIKKVSVIQDIQEIFAKKLSFIELVNEILPVSGTNAAAMSQKIGKSKSYWSVIKATTGPGKAPYYLDAELAERMAKVFGLSDELKRKFLESHALYVDQCAREKSSKSAAKIKSKEKETVETRSLPKPEAKRVEKKVRKTVKAKLSKRGPKKNAAVSCNKLGITAEMVILFVVERLCLGDSQKFGDICHKAGVEDIRNINGNAVQAIVEFTKTLGDKNQEAVSFLSRLLKLLFDEPIVFKVVGDEVNSIEKALRTLSHA